MDNYVHNPDEWKDTEEEISRYSDIVSLTEYKRTQAAEAIDNVQVGLVPYLVKPGFSTDKLHFKDGKYRTLHRRKNLFLHLYDIKNNYVYSRTSPDFFESLMLDAVEKEYITPFLLFVDDVFIPWSKLKLVKSSKYLTAIIDGYDYDYEPKDVSILMLPTKVSYSEDSYAKDGTKIQFRFNERGLFDPTGNIVVGTLHPKAKVLVYRNQEFRKFKLDINTKKKIPRSSVAVFTPDGKFSTYYRVVTYAGNLLTIDDPFFRTHPLSAVVTYFDEGIDSEDYINRFPNNVLARRIAAEETITDVPGIDTIDVKLMQKEFDFKHLPSLSYEENINNSIQYIFDYDKNKFDPIFDNNSAMHCCEYTYTDIVKRMDADGWVTMSRDIYGKSNFHNETYVMIFHNNELPEYYKDIVYEHDIFKFKPTNLGVNDFIEIVYIKNIRNEVLPIDQEHKTDDTYLNVSDYYIPPEELLVYTNKLGDHALCPLNIKYDYETGKVKLPKDEYINTDLYVGSVNQFRYAKINIKKETNAISLPLYFNSAYNQDKFLLFINGRLLNSIYYKTLVPTLSEPKINFKVIYTMKTVKPTDRVEVFYLGMNTGKGLESYTNNLVIKSIMSYATSDMQTTFEIPLPFKDYDASAQGAVAVFKHGLFKSPETYYTYKDGDKWYITFLDQDDECIIGEEVTFLFPYYSTKPYMYSIPTDNNSTQYLPKTVTVATDTTDVDFGDLNMIDNRSVLVFKNSQIQKSNAYTIEGSHIRFTDTVKAGTDVTAVVCTDKKKLESNNIKISHYTYTITSKAENPITLPKANIPDSYMVFFNGKLMDPNDYGITRDKLVIMHREDFNRTGDKIEFIYAENLSNKVLSINFYPISLTMPYTDFVDLPGFSPIDMNPNTMVLFANGEYVEPSKYTVDRNSINFDSGMPAGTKITVYFAYETLNRYYTPYSLSTSIDKNKFVMDEAKVKIEQKGQRRFTIPYPENNKEIPFIIHMRGIFIPANNYTITMDRSAIVFEDGLDEKLIPGQHVRFIFVYNGNGAYVNKHEYTNRISEGETTIHLPELFKSEVDYNDYMMLFYDGVYLDKNRYYIDSDNRVITLTDIPRYGENQRQFSVVLFHTGSDENGTINYLPSSGFLYLDMDKIDRNITKENTMIFINGKKIAKHQLIDVTNYLKKLTMDIKTRFGMEIINLSPKVFELKDRYNEIKRDVKTACHVTINQTPNQTIRVRCNGSIFSSSFTAKSGDIIDVYVQPVNGYVAGNPSVTTMALTGDVTIEATPALKGDLQAVTINQSDNQLISVRCNGEIYTKSFKEIKGKSFVANIESTNPKYNHGTLSIKRGTIGDDPIVIEATPATVKDVVFEIPDQNLEYQTFTAYLYDDTMTNILQTITTPGIYNAKYGQFVSVSVEAARGYKPGGLNIYGEYGAVELTKDKTIISLGTPIGPIKYNIQIPKYDNQDIIVAIKPKDEDIFNYYTYKSKKVEAQYGDTFDISITPLSTYVAGKVYTNYENRLTGIIDKELVISADPAELRTELVTISVESDPHAEIKVVLDSGAIINEGQSMSVIRGTHYRVECDVDYDYSTPSLNTWEGTADVNTEIKVLYPAERLTAGDRSNQAYIDLQPKDGCMITVFNKTTNKSHINSFWCNYGDELVFKLTTETEGLYTKLNVPDNMTINTLRRVVVTNSYPIPLSQVDYTSYLNKPKGTKVNIHIDNPLDAFYEITLIDGSEETHTDMENIPIGTSISVKLTPLAVNPGKLFINGIYIPEGVRTINVGTYDNADILTQCTELTVSCSTGYPITTDTDPDTNKVTVVDRPLAIIMTDSQNYEHQTIHLYRYDGNTGTQKEVTLPYTIKMDTENNLVEYRAVSIADEGYVPGKLNYNIIKPIEGATYILDCDDARKIGE